MKNILILFTILLIPALLYAENGSELWLRYKTLPDSVSRKYTHQLQYIALNLNSPTRKIVKSELDQAFAGLLGSKLTEARKIQKNTLIICTFEYKWVKELISGDTARLCGEEGFLLKSLKVKDGRILILAAKQDAGLLYGTF